MVARTLGRSSTPDDDGVLESGLKENLSQQLGPLVERLKNRLVIFGLFMVGFAIFGFYTWDAYQQNVVLQSKIADQKAILAVQDGDPSLLEDQLQTFITSRDQVRELQVLGIPDSDLVDRIYATSQTTGVVISSISTSNAEIVIVGAEAYEVTPVLVRVSGDVASIESFLSLIESGAIGTAEVKNSLLAPEDSGFVAAIRAIVFNKPVDISLLDEEEREELSRRVSDAELDAAAGAIK